MQYILHQCTDIRPVGQSTQFMKMKFILGIFLLSSSISQIYCIKYGSCPNVETMQSFDMERYYGKWWEMERYPNMFEMYTRCVTDTYRRLPNGNIEVLYNRIGTWTNSNRTTSGYLEVPDSSQPEKMRAHFSDYIPSGNYWIIDTDYSSYSIVYTCVDFSYFHTELLWIMSREKRRMSSDLQGNVYNILTSRNIDTSQLIQSDLEGC